jgi:cold shock CspA family protein
MQVPLKIQFRNIDASPSVEAAVREHVAKLERLADPLISCSVTIEAPHQHHRQGNLYTVSIDVHYPGGEAVANRRPSAAHAHEDVYGTIASLDPQRSGGRIVTPEGRSLYFHANSVLNAKFEALTVGAPVRFDEEAGDEGPQASSVHVIGKHHVVG